MVPIACKRKSEILVATYRVCHQLRQAGRMKQASRDTPSKGAAQTGDNRKPRREGVCRGRMRIVGQGVEEEIGALETREVVLRFRDEGGEYEAFPINIPGLRLAAEVAHRCLIQIR